MADTAQDRTLPATARKIGKAREQGQLPRSRDLGHFAALFAAGLVLLAVAPEAAGWLKRQIAAGLSFDALTVADPRRMATALADAAWRFTIVVIPVGALMAAVGVASSVGSGGWNFSLKALHFKWERFDIFAGLGRVFSWSQVLLALKACLLALVLGMVAALFLQFHGARFVQSLAMPLPAALAHVADAVWLGLALLMVALGVFALVDVPLQRFVWLRNLRMSHEEVKKEHKDVEGNTEVKSKMKLRMRETANRRMLAAVPRADMVVMNPTHFAVALKYDEASMGAPTVLAKGADLMAFRIRDAAREARVPVLEVPALARALYAHAEIDREIPAALFAAVAQVLAWVYQLRAAMAGRSRAPGDLPDPQVPPELDPKARSLKALPPTAAEAS